MKLLPVALIGGGIYLATRAWNTGQAVKRLEYSNPRVRVAKVGLLKTELEITLDLKNPASTDVYLDYFSGNINYANKKLSSFTFNAGKSVNLRGRQITTVPFTIVISNLGALQTIAALVKAITAGGKVNTVLNIDGGIYAAGLDVPVNFNYDLKSNTLAGIGSCKATLEFGSNSELEKYFSRKRMDKKIMFSKN